MTELLPWLLSGGGLTAIGAVLTVFHRSAVSAHKQRADDWRSAWEAERTAAAEATRQLSTVLEAVHRAGTVL